MHICIICVNINSCIYMCDHVYIYVSIDLHAYIYLCIYIYPCLMCGVAYQFSFMFDDIVRDLHL